MPSTVSCNYAKLVLMFEVGLALWTILGLASILTLGAEKGSTLDDEMLSSILVANSWASWIV